MTVYPNPAPPSSGAPAAPGPTPGEVVAHAFPQGTLLLGDVRAALATLPGASVQTCATSPPYWGLRDYATSPQIWGGDPACDHAWENHGKRHSDGRRANSADYGKQTYLPSTSMTNMTGQTCALCGAWQGELGGEPTPSQYVAHMVEVFRAVRRVLRPDATLWLNLGDSYASTSTYNAPRTRHTANGWKQAGRQPNAGLAGLVEKNLIGIPWRVAFALQDDGWVLRSDIIWSKPNPMTESMTDRPTKAHEYIFLFALRPRYYYDHAAIKEPGQAIGGHPCGPKTDASRNDGDRTGIVRGDGTTRNKRSVWTVPTTPYPGAHFATWPEALVRPMVLAGSRPGDLVLDPFAGSGTTLAVAQALGRRWVGVELGAGNLPLIQGRIAAVTPWYAADPTPRAPEGWTDLPLFATEAGHAE